MVSEAPRAEHELAPLNEARLVPHSVTIAVAPGHNGTNPEGKEDNRAAWTGKMQFFLSIIGYSVGLGNIWRFPYYCQQNGGGAFLIPYFVMLILEGIPLFLIELGIGQRMKVGALGVWNNIHPWLGGIGIASCIVAFFVLLYYNVIITWCFYYMINSITAVVKSFTQPGVKMQDTLAWAKCPVIDGVEVEECVKSSSTAYFWYRTTLDSSPSIAEPEGLKWWIVLCLLLSWVVVFFVMMRGIQSSGKVIYFTSLFPYVVLTIFFVRGVTLKGASEGLAHMYMPKLEKLLEPTVWLDAATQVFYSFGLAFGSLIAFGSYNTPDNNCVRDVILVSFCNAFTAIFASAVVFAILGFKAVSNVDNCLALSRKLLMSSGFLSDNSTNEEFEHARMTFNATAVGANFSLASCSLENELNTAAEGTGLAFVVFTQAIVELPGAPFWSCTFFLMLLALGIGSQIGLLEGMLCVIFDIDLFKRISKPYITGGICLICFLIGLIFCTGAGEYWLKLFDSFASTLGLVVVALLEMTAVVFVYGHEKFTQDIEDMTGHRPGWYWQITWRFLAPIIMVCILVSSMFSMIMNRPQYSAWNASKAATESLYYPDWVLAVAIVIIFIGIAPIPIVFLLRRFQCFKLDVNIHQGSIRRIETTVSTKEMMGDVDIDEYQDRLGDFPEEEEGNSDDDNTIAPQTFKAMASKQHQGKGLRMRRMDY